MATEKLSNEDLIKQKKEVLDLKERNVKILADEVMYKRVEESFIKRDYLRDNFFKSLGVLFFTFLTFSSAIWYASYSYFVYTPPSKFLALDEENRVLEEVPLNERISEDSILTQWVNDEMKKILTYNYISFPTHGEKIKSSFTESGFGDFMEAFNSLRLQIKVKEQKAIIEPLLVQPLKIKDIGATGGGTRMAWMLEGVIILNIHGYNGIERQKYQANVLVIRTTFKENKNGIAIQKIQLIN